MSESTIEHRAKAPTHLNFAILTISTSRYRRQREGKSVENPSANIIANLLERAGHKVVFRDIVPDEKDHIRKNLQKIVRMSKVDAVITCGGTGIARTDITIETVAPLLDKVLLGFGEIFRKLSFETIGSAAILTRAVAGIINGRAVFCLPGSPQAVETALTGLIIAEVGHILKHAKE